MGLRVAVNLMWLVPGVVGGTEYLTVETLRALAAHGDGSDIDVTLFALDSLAEVHPDLADAFAIEQLGLRGRLRGARVAAESTWLARRLRQGRFDVVHHAGGVVPFNSPGPIVVTVHDIQPLEFPENFSALKRRYLGAMLPRSIRAAQVTVVASEFVRGTLIERLGAVPERVQIVPPCGVSGTPNHVHSDVVLRRGISRPFVLYPAITYPHKNHVILVEALARLHGTHLELVFTGGSGGAEDALAARIAELGLNDRVHRLGRVSRVEVDTLIAASAGVVMPSRYEGFGLPALEAMSAGVPVAVSDAGSLPEVVGDGAAIVAADDVDGWTSTLLDLATGRGVAHSAMMSGAGRAAAARFTPARTAAALVEAYRAAAGHV